MFEVEPNSIADTEPLHARREVGLRGFDQQMIMIGHEHLGVPSPAESLHRLPQQFAEVPIVLLLAINGSALIAARGDVIPRSGSLNA